MLEKYEDQGKRNWLTTAESLYKKFQSESNISLDIFVSKSETVVKAFIKNTLRKQYESQWRSLITDVNKQPKLRTYCTFKMDLKREKYLSIIIPKQRQAIAKFRCSSHHLAIETGRHNKPKLPVECRKCLDCDTVKDEVHHLIHCKSNHVRVTILFNIVSSEISNFKNVKPEIQFKQLLLSDNINILKSIAEFLINSGKN